MLLKNATIVEKIDAEFGPIFTEDVFRKILAVVPDEWLVDSERELSAADAREVYVSFLKQRVASSSIFVKQIEDARKNLI
ncbi:hypothetical protein D3C81_2112870 [compost metagenome]